MNRAIIWTAVVMTAVATSLYAAEGGKAQTNCPVQGGEIDKEVFVDVDGKRVYFCCPGCDTKFLSWDEASKNAAITLWVDSVFRRFYSRLPDDEERRTIINYLEQRTDRTKDAVSQILWALMTSAEFRFNH